MRFLEVLQRKHSSSCSRSSPLVPASFPHNSVIGDVQGEPFALKSLWVSHFSEIQTTLHHGKRNQNCTYCFCGLKQSHNLHGDVERANSA